MNPDPGGLPDTGSGCGRGDVTGTAPGDGTSEVAVAVPLGTTEPVEPALGPAAPPQPPPRAEPAGPVLLGIERGDPDDDDIAAVTAAVLVLIRDARAAEDGTVAGTRDGPLDGVWSATTAGRAGVDPWAARHRGRPATSPVTARWG